MLVNTQEIIEIIANLQKEGEDFVTTEWIKKCIKIICQTLIERIKIHEDIEMGQLLKNYYEKETNFLS